MESEKSPEPATDDKRVTVELVVTMDVAVSASSHA